MTYGYHIHLNNGSNSFMGFDWICQHGGLNSSDYCEVYAGTIEADNEIDACEALYARLHLEQPEGYKGRSFSFPMLSCSKVRMNPNRPHGSVTALASKTLREFSEQQ